MNSATAVIITGQARTFKHCYKTQREAVFRLLVNPHFFVSVSDDEQAKDMGQLLADFPQHQIFIERVKQPELDPVVESRYLAASAHAPWGISVPVIGIYRQFWALARGMEFFLERCPADVQFNQFVRIRPDLYFHNFTLPLVPPGYHMVFAPQWGSWGGCPDRFAFIQGFDAACAYFNTFHRIETLLAAGCAFHPETMLARSLEMAAVKVRQTMDAEFTTIRMQGDKRPHDKPSYSNRDLLRYVSAKLAEAQE